MDKRYEAIILDEGWGILDHETTELVVTVSGLVYTAPVENAEWAALTLNKRLAKQDATPVLADPTPEPDDFDQEHEKAHQPNPVALLHVMIPESPRHTAESPVERERRLGQEEADRRHVHTLEYARRLGQLEARVHGLRAMVIGVQAGLGRIPDGYDALKTRLAVEDIAQLRQEIERIIAAF